MSALDICFVNVDVHSAEDYVARFACRRTVRFGGRLPIVVSVGVKKAHMETLKTLEREHNIFMDELPLDVGSIL
eukprot:SAG31_NODE_2106_length_6430_cov_3.620755_5_plen_74_part_00